MSGHSQAEIRSFIYGHNSSDQRSDNEPAAYDQDSFFSQHDNSLQQAENNDIAYTKTLPDVLLFKDLSGVRIIDTAESLGNIFGKKEILFRRGTESDQAQQVQALDKERNLRILSPELACSEFEKVANIVYSKNRRTVPAILKESDSKRILCCSSFIEKLPLLRIVTKCPVIVETSDGNTKVITRYDPDTGIYAMGEKPEDVDLKDAIAILLSSIEEFHFKSPADKSRAAASVITPAIIMGGIEDFRRKPSWKRF
jgi:hypothetical protein